jgi:hypothetical protein
MGWRRAVRYYRERMPGSGVMLNSIDRGRDAPLTPRDSLTLVMLVLGVVVLAVAVAGAYALFA